MFGRWFTKKNKHCYASAGNQVRPFLERLEERDCPSAPQITAPQITAFDATILQGQTVLLAGMVSDPNPGSVSLSFNGVAAGSTWADSTGRFQLQTQASALGTVYAIGCDGDGQWSNNAQANLSVAAPTFSNLMVMQSGANRAITISGQVSSGLGLTVSLSGIVTGTATTGINGVFTFSGTASGLGQVNASVTDVWGQTGTGTAQLNNTAPTITNFSATFSGSENIWIFTGQVTDEWAAGETVTFAGLLPLQNVTATVSSSGWFTVRVQLSPADNGMVVATVTDWYGATGQAQFYV
jgi:hypothetical protein